MRGVPMSNNFKIAYHPEKKNTLKGLDKNLLPEQIIYNNNGIIAFFKCSSELFDFKTIKQYKEFDTDDEGYSKLFDISQYFELLKEIIDENKAKIIMNLFFNINPKFNRFHFYWHNLVPKYNRSRTLYCAILASAKDKLLIDDSLKFLYSSYNFKKSYQEQIEQSFSGKGEFRDYTAFLIDISTFYHMTNERIFAVKKSLFNKLKFTKGEWHETIGKNDFDRQDDPDRNPLHPDAPSR